MYNIQSLIMKSVIMGVGVREKKIVMSSN